VRMLDAAHCICIRIQHDLFIKLGKGALTRMQIHERRLVMGHPKQMIHRLSQAPHIPRPHQPPRHPILNRIPTPD